MSQIQSIQKIIKLELNRFNQAFTESLQTDNPILQSVFEYIFKQKGKQLRPMLVLLTAKMLKDVNNATIQGATAMELLHTASLIHDDVIDDTYERRGNPSIKAKWNNKVAVLSGDYILSIALSQISETQNFQMIKTLSSVGAQLSGGELLQLKNSNTGLISEEEYYQIIKKKTALLFSACTKIGALSVNTDKKSIQSLIKYGEYLGYCFQIKDDIFDYIPDADIGKPTQNDLKDGKITLPLIHAIKKASTEESEHIIQMIESNNLSEEDINYIYHFAVKKGGLEFAQQQMDTYKKKAIETLSDFPDNTYKRALIECVEYAVNRDN